MQHFGLKEKDLLAHETVSFKSPGEGENIKEFLSARFAYPGLVGKLEALAAGNAALAALAAEEKNLAAAPPDRRHRRRKTPPLSSRQRRGQGAARPAFGFLRKILKRSAQLAELVEFLAGAGAGQAAGIAKRVAAWVR